MPTACAAMPMRRSPRGPSRCGSPDRAQQVRARHPAPGEGQRPRVRGAQAHLALLLPTVKPGVPFSTSRQVMPRLASAGFVDTKTTKSLASPAFDTQDFSPSSTNASPSKTARQRMPPASLPARAPEAVGAHGLAARQARQPRAFLLVGAEARQRPAGQGVVDAQGPLEGRAAPRELLHRGGDRHRRGPGPRRPRRPSARRTPRRPPRPGPRPAGLPPSHAPARACLLSANSRAESRASRAAASRSVHGPPFRTAAAP